MTVAPDTRVLVRGDSRGMVLLLLVILGAVYPLTDPDLPLHLLVGEWIVKHGAVPTVEPFAWTREGEPYYAYSWLPQVVFYGIWRVAGVFGLRIVYGLLLAGSAAAMMRLARMAEWPRGVAMVMVALHVAAFGIAVPSLRPQAVLFITVPLVWSAVLRLISNPGCRRSLGVLFASSALSAASHIFFPLTMVPLVGLWVGRSAARPTLMAVAAVVAGWLVSPYVLEWPRVFALNFAPNAMLGPGSPIAELAPGFSGIAMLEMVFVMAIFAGVFLGVFRGPLSDRARIAAVLLLVAGVGAFAYANRLIVVFWILVAPVAGHVLALWMESEHRVWAMRAAGVMAMMFVIASVVHSRHLGAWTSEGFTSRALAWPDDSIAAPATRQWQCLERVPDRARIFTRLRYANMLAWKLRPHSMSIDSRTIFPDSVAVAELKGHRMRSTAVWRSADAAVLDRRDPIAGLLESASGWTQLPPDGVADLGAPVVWLNSGRFDFGSPSKRDACVAKST